ncbi:SDR family NAD(P)-dependent oxidoreductase [Seohaeicola saemankumensis]|nr:SDR family NAD(P)-dependent oxidoreductase [Seohaeicola saemankumensis]MCA0871887.1 SDR family NAD(P)-dependent oxidoreductase [Seohaeicola saemankumensis]
MRFEGKRMAVTGASRGIGAALARQLVGAGATVLAVARDAERLQAMAADLGPGLIPVPCDLADAQARRALIAKLGPVDGLINNAALQIESDYAQVGHDPAADIGREVAVNFEAPLHLGAALLPVLAARPEALIVNVTSALALAPKRSAPVYCATKAGLRNFTTGLRYQAERSCPQVQVVEVVMTLVETGMTTGRGRGKISPNRAAAEVLNGLRRDKRRIWAGKTQTLRVIYRLSPGLAARILRDG